MTPTSRIPSPSSRRGGERHTSLPALALFLTVAVAMLFPVAAVGQYFPADQDLQVMLDYLVEDGATTGVALGVIDADGSTRVLTAGSGGPDTQPLGPRSVFEIGSITKTFTAILLAEMAARGEVSLDDPIGLYLPEGVTAPWLNGVDITLADLSTHHSGLPRLPDNHVPGNMADPYSDYTVETLYAFLSAHELRREPGAEFEYSNLGVGLLGHLLARAADRPYRDLLRERVLEPLGMEMTGFEADGDMAAWMTEGHSIQGQPVSHWSATEAIEGAGGLVSSTADMLLYLEANLDAATGSADSDLHRAMQTTHVMRESLTEDVGAGLGWQILIHDGREILTHDGGSGGYTSRIGFDRELGIGFVLLANTAQFEGHQFGFDFLRFGPVLEIPEVLVAGEVLDGYVGEYEMAPGTSMFVRREDDGNLTMEAFDNVRARMYAESDTSFFLKRNPWLIDFTVGEGGEIVSLDLTIGGETRTWQKVSDQTPPAGPVEVLDLPVSDADIARYEGTYLLRLGEQALELEVFARDGQLMAQAAGQGAGRLRFQGDHTFIPEFDARLVFTVEDDRAVRVTLHQRGQTAVGERRPDSP